MPWQDRLRDAVYTSPEGTRIRFDFEAVSRDTTKRTTAFEFPGFDDVYVQDNGHGARRYPMLCFFSGDDHDLEAAAFEAALLERGVGQLEHPFYGTFDVVPFGDIARRDDLKEAANQTIIRVTFWTSISALFPELQTARRSDVLGALATLELAAGEEFEDNADLSTVAARANTEVRTKGLLNQANAALGPSAAASPDVLRDFQDALVAIENSLDILVNNPLELAEQIVEALAIPARSVADIDARLAGYADLATRIITSLTALPEETLVGGVTLPGRSRTISNDFHLNVVFASSAVAGAVRSVLDNQFTARPEAIAAAEEILAQLDVVVEWQDRGFEALSAADANGSVDTGATYQALQESVALGAGFLVEISFTLLPERSIVLDRPRTIVDLVAELYGSVDDRLDFLIETNALTGSEILELPRGKTIVFYA